MHLRTAAGSLRVVAFQCVRKSVRQVLASMALEQHCR